MTTLRLIGWRKGLRTVSLITALVEYAGISLAQAKDSVERLIDGDELVITFREEQLKDAFRNLAEGFGAIVEDSH